VARKSVVRHRDIVVSASLAALIIAAAVLVHVMFIAPTTSLATLQRKNVAEARKRLSDIAKEAQQMEEKKARNDDLRAKLAVFSQRVRKKNQVAGLFAQILQLSDRSNLKLLHTQPMTSAPLGQGLHKFPYTIEVQGGYHDIAQFITTIESHADLMQVIGVSLGGMPEGIRARIGLCLYGADAGWSVKEEAEEPGVGDGAEPTDGESGPGTGEADSDTSGTS